MNTRELTAALGIDTAKLGEWIREGLPNRKVGRGNAFDPDQVKQWLLANGHVKGPRYAATIDQAAAALDIDPRTLSRWFGQGAPGRTAHGYDLDALTAWKADRQQADPLLTGPSSPALEKYREERYLLARLERQAKERELVPRALVENWISSFLSVVRQTLTTLRSLAGDAAVELVVDGLREGEQSFWQEWGTFLKASGLTTVLTKIEEERQRDSTNGHNAEDFPGNIRDDGHRRKARWSTPVRAAHDSPGDPSA